MNKIAIITGASRGIGRSAALHLAQRNIDIIFTYQSQADAAKSLIEEVSALGQKAIALQHDVRNIACTALLIDEIRQTLATEFHRDSFDYLLNNAGTGLNSAIESTSEEEFDDMFAIHVKGPFFLTQALFPLISADGHVVNISTGLTRFSFPGYAAYAMAKGAVEAMTRYMAKEFASKRVRVNTLAPGAIATDFRDGSNRDSSEARSMIANITAFQRVGEPEDIGKAIAALFSDDFGWITGQRIEASGGMLL